MSGTIALPEERAAGLEASLVKALLFSLFFAAPALNGRPYLFSAGLASLLGIPLLYRVLAVRKSLRADATALVFAAFPIVVTFSYVANFDDLERADGIANLTFGAVLPAICFLAVRSILVDAASLRIALAGALSGIALRFSYGLDVYYREWGIPSAIDILWSRYDTIRIDGYAQAMFGNTSSLAAMLTLLSSLLLALIAARTPPAFKGMRIVAGAALALTVLHAVIVLSRTYFLVLPIIFIVASVAFRRRLMMAAAMAIVIGIAAAAPALNTFDQFEERFSSAVNVDTEDRSVDERLESIRAGWAGFKDHPWFGVGFNYSQSENRFFNAHQFNVDMAHEMGLPGLIWSVALMLVVGARTFTLFISAHGAPDGRHDPAFAFQIAAFAFLLYGAVGNVPLNNGITNNWVLLFSLVLGTAEALRTRAGRQDGGLR